jgi:hypothetical protein
VILNNRILPKRIVLGLLCGLATAVAVASGGEDPSDSFVARPIPDIHPNRYEQGDLGILLPSYQRLYLYPAWRAIVLGRQQVAKTKPGLEHAVLTNGATGWYTASSGTDSSDVGDWNAASRTYAEAGRKEAVQDMRNIPDGFSSYIVCPSGAFSFATQTLNALKSRKDATPERLQAWVAAQDNVFQFCDYDPNPSSYARNKKVTALPIPAPLPRSEPEYWQQLRQYQIAAAHFYNDQFEDSARLFKQIGADKSHPMRVWGSYLALRAQLRAADLSREPEEWRKKYFAQIQALTKMLPPKDYEQQKAALERGLERDERQRGDRHLAVLERDAAQILNNASLAAVHDATRALLRRARARLSPLSRIDELAGILDNAERNPHEDDHLFDWTFLLAGQTEYAPNKAFLADLYQRHPFMRWIDSVQQCGLTGSGKLEERLDAAANANCAAQYQTVLSKWKALSAARTGKHGEAAAWFVTALMLSSELTLDLEAAALTVEADAPEYLTVRYHLARLYRHAAEQQPASTAESEPRKKARAIAEDALNSDLTKNLGSTSVNNLFRQERFAAATSVSEALAYLLRRETMPWIARTEARRVARYEGLVLQQDGVRWLNGQLSLQDMVTVARDQGLPMPLRTQLASVVWLRADLLGNWRMADTAARLLSQQSPLLAAAATSYQQTKDANEKHHLALLTGMQYNLSAYVLPYQTRPLEKDLKPAGPEDTTASMWCRLPEDGGAIYQAEAERVPSPPRVTNDPRVRDEEARGLAGLKTATGHVGDHVLRRASTHPKDADLPWLLHVVVKSTRGGCLDKDSSVLSRTAFRLLHKRYPDNEWTRATRYWY